jgi:RNA ligase
MDKRKLPQEITTLTDIQTLASSGFDDWKRYGEVSVDADSDLLIFNYTPKAQYEARWNFFERVSRGLIVNRATGEIVARPFDKFFNWSEDGRYAAGHIVTVTEKMDGSLGILYRLNGSYRISTRGAFHSEQAEWATKFLNANFDLNDLPNDLTLLFEIIYPENRVVVDYHGEEKLVLLAARNRVTGDYLPFFPDVYEMGQKYNLPLPKVFTFNNVSDIIRITGSLSVDEEGYVIEFSDGQRFKIKGDRYLEMHRLIFGLSFKNTLLAVMNDTVDYVRSQLPDEFLKDFNRWVNEIQTTIAETKHNVQAAFNAAPKATRKEFAIWVMENHKAFAPYLFAMFDGKDLMPMIYKMAFQDRPNEKAVKQTESTA